MEIQNTKEASLILTNLQLRANSRYPQYARSGQKDVDSFIRDLTKQFDGIPDEILPLIDQIKDAWKKLPTEYEDIQIFSLCCSILPQLAVEAEELGLELPDTISFGTTCAGEIDSRVYLIQNGKDYLLVINRQILLLAQFFCDYLVKISVEKISEDESVEILNGMIHFLSNRLSFILNTEGNIDIVDAIGAFIEQPPMYHHQLEGLGPRILFNIFYDSMYSFILSHELVHISLTYMESIGKKIETSDKELFCDLFGYRISRQFTTSRYIKEIDKDFPWQYFSAPNGLYFLSCYELFEKLQYIEEISEDLPAHFSEVDLHDLKSNYYNGYPTTILRKLILEFRIVQDFEDNDFTKEKINELINYYYHINTSIHNLYPRLEKKAIDRKRYRAKLLKDAKEYMEKRSKNK